MSCYYSLSLLLYISSVHTLSHSSNWKTVQCVNPFFSLDIIFFFGVYILRSISLFLSRSLSFSTSPFICFNTHLFTYSIFEFFFNIHRNRNLFSVFHLTINVQLFDVGIAILVANFTLFWSNTCGIIFGKITEWNSNLVNI